MRTFKFGSAGYLRKANEKAQKLGDFSVKYSTTGKKKLDVYNKKGIKIADIGHRDYSDHLQHGSDSRRESYHKRHAKTAKVKFSNSYFAKNILW